MWYPTLVLGAGGPEVQPLGRAPSQASGLIRGSLCRWAGGGTRALPGAGNPVGAVPLTPPVCSTAYYPDQGWVGTMCPSFQIGT